MTHSSRCELDQQKGREKDWSIADSQIRMGLEQGGRWVGEAGSGMEHMDGRSTKRWEPLSHQFQVGRYCRSATLSWLFARREGDESGGIEHTSPPPKTCRRFSAAREESGRQGDREEALLLRQPTTDRAQNDRRESLWPVGCSSCIQICLGPDIPYGHGFPSHIIIYL